MPNQNISGLDMFCARPPDVEIVEGMVRVTHYAGDHAFSFVYSRSCLIKAMAKGAEVLASWEDGAEIIPFPAEQFASSFHVKRP